MGASLLLTFCFADHSNLDDMREWFRTRSPDALPANAKPLYEIFEKWHAAGPPAPYRPQHPRHSVPARAHTYSSGRALLS